MPRRDWSPKEQLLALRLYCALPFGKLHQSNPDVINIAKAIGRTPSAVAMKACNFASLDPALDRKGLGNVSQADKELWSAFQHNSDEIASKVEKAYEEFTGSTAEDNGVDDLQAPQGDTEVIRQVRTRRVQGFFRRAVLVGYENKCALSGLTVPDLLIASHIIPWKIDVERRADPTNGIALNALYDRAFDKGLLTFDSDLRVILSNRLKSELSGVKAASQLFDIENRPLLRPVRFQPDMEAIRYHRDNIFQW